jgi:hypothetical protein
MVVHGAFEAAAARSTLIQVNAGIGCNRHVAGELDDGDMT